MAETIQNIMFRSRSLKKYAMRIVVRAPQMEVTRITEMRSNGTQIRPDHESNEGDESITCDLVWIDEMPEAKADEPADQKKKSDPVEDEGNDCGQKTGADGKRQGDRRGLIRVGTRCITGGRAEKKSGNDAPELAERIAEETVQQGKNNHNQKKLLLVNTHDVPDFIETAKQRVDVKSLHIQIHDIHSYMMYRKNRYRLYFSTERRFWQVKLCLRSGKRQNGGGVHMV